MRRGLMGRNEAELPVAAIEARLTRLRSAMDAAGLDAFVVYTNNVRPSAVTWLTRASSPDATPSSASSVLAE